MLFTKTFRNILTISGLTLAMVTLSHANIHADSIMVNQNSTNVSSTQNTDTKQTDNNSNNNLKVYQANSNNNSNNQSKPVQNTAQQPSHRFQRLYRVAHSKLGDPYAWGATGPHRFDCAGFTQYVYKHGIHKHIPRTAEAQRQYCKRVSYKHAKPGDLAFFGYGTAGHVGLYLGKDMMIDAQNRGVVIEHVHAPWWHILGFGRVPKKIHHHNVHKMHHRKLILY